MASGLVVDAVKAIRNGGIVVVVDDEHRENEGDLVIAAEHAAPEAMAFFVRHTSGFICTAITSDRADELQLPLMVPRNTERQRTAFTVTVDYHNGTTCGGSAVDRARTARALGDSRTQPADFERPGHMHVLRAEPLGVLRRPGHTEAAVDLARLAGLAPAGVLCELVTKDGLGMARGAELEAFAVEHGLPLMRIEDLIRYRRSNERLVRRMRESFLPTEFGEFQALEYESAIDGSGVVALVMGSPSAGRETLVGVHTECLAGDVFGSRACTCRQDLEASLYRISQARTGVVVYLREAPDGHQREKFGEDDRCAVAQVLSDLGVADVGLITGGEASEWLELGLRVQPAELATFPRARMLALSGQFADDELGDEGDLVLPA